MSDERLALVVAVDRYDNPALSRLAAPAADARALAEVLGSPDLGGFSVDIVHNATSWATSQRVDELLADRMPSDLVLLHFSCHGLKDDGGELYLAATDTAPQRLASTAIAANWINRQMQRSRAQSIVLLLDCCYGGAFERGVVARAAGDVDVTDQFRHGQLTEGRGRAVITASTAMEYAFEGPRLAEDAQGEPSVFTGSLVEGIRTGDADLDQDGNVSLSELYDYVYDRVRERSPRQTPSKWEFGLRGGLFVAHNPRRKVTPARLPQELLDLIEHPTSAARIAGAEELGRLASGTNLSRAAAARLALSQLSGDDSRRVSELADEILARTAVRLSTSMVDLGRVRRGAPSVAGQVAVHGGPLALASSVTTSTIAVRCRIDGDTLRIVWAPDVAGRLDAVVAITGPAGEAQLRVVGECCDPNPSNTPSPAPPSSIAPGTQRPGPVERFAQDDGRTVSSWPVASPAAHAARPRPVPEPPSRLELSASLVDFGVITQGTPSERRMIHLRNRGGSGNLHARASTTDDWIELRQTDADVLVSVKTVEVGVRHGVVTVNSNEGSATVQVMVHVKAARTALPPSPPASPTSPLRQIPSGGLLLPTGGPPNMARPVATGPSGPPFVSPERPRGPIHPPARWPATESPGQLPQMPWGPAPPIGTMPYSGTPPFPPTMKPKARSPAPAALALAITALCLATIPPAGLVASIVALFRVRVARKRINQQGGSPRGKTAVTWAMAISWVALAISVLLTPVFIAYNSGVESSTTY